MMKLLLCLALVGLGVSLPTGTDTMDKDAQMKYLEEFGYMGEDSPMFAALTEEEAYPKAIAEFQVMAGLEPTGEMNEETMKTMMLPRCGTRDMENKVDATKRRRKRYALEGSMWGRGEITYRISQYTNDMSREEVDKEVTRAFQVWSSVTNLNFRQSDSNRVDIDIAFVPRSHGDGFDFDGAGGTLAHAFFPRYGGDVHMDEAEQWTLETYQGINLFQVIAHEFGHSLGLQHSNIQAALMAPFYRGYVPDFELDQDDIMGIQAIYGVRSGMMDTTTRSGGAPPTSPPITTTMVPVDPGMAPMPCSDGRIDAIIMSEDGTVYAFYNDYYMVINDYGIAPGYPRKISDDWQGLPDSLDAAINFESVYGYVFNRNTRRYSRTKLIDERVFFFKGSLVYLYESGSKQLSAGYPKAISEAFPGLPNDIDAAFRWSRNNKPYFMKGQEYYRYSNGRIVSNGNGGYEETTGMVDANYPRPLSVWTGLPDSIDAAFVWRNGRTYFFKDDVYYRFDDRYVQVSSGYPRSTRGAWFGCSGQIEADVTTGKMMMEAEMTLEPRFDVMENGDDVSGQSRLQAWSLGSLVSLLVVRALCQ